MPRHKPDPKLIDKLRVRAVELGLGDVFDKFVGDVSADGGLLDAHAAELDRASDSIEADDSTWAGTLIDSAKAAGFPSVDAYMNAIDELPAKVAREVLTGDPYSHGARTTAALAEHRRASTPAAQQQRGAQRAEPAPDRQALLDERDSLREQLDVMDRGPAFDRAARRVDELYRLTEGTATLSGGEGQVGAVAPPAPAPSEVPQS